MQKGEAKIDGDSSNKDPPKQSSKGLSKVKEKTDDNGNLKGVTAFTPELQQVISQIIPSADPLDKPDFNSIDFINSMFPNEQSLVNLDKEISKMKLKISRTDEEILKSVREQVSAGSKGKRDLEEAKRAISELFTKINDIKSKAEQSEKMVTEICRDIKSLDYAKRNLTATITALRRIQMLITAVDQLKIMSSKRQYHEAAQLLEAVNQLAQHFSNYKHIPKIAELTTQVSEIQANMKKQVYNEFDNFLDAPQSVNTTTLADACLAIDSLGKDVKKEFMSWFCTQQLREYNRIFRPGEESASLEHAERRFSWLKKILRAFDEQYDKIFPSHWRMSELICEEFCFTTRQHLTDVLEASKHKLDVDVLVGTLKKTLAFEKELCDRFGPIEVEYEPSPEELSEEANDESEELTEEEQLNPQSASAIRARWKRYQNEKLKKQRAEKKPGRQIQKFKNIISSCFDLYMDLYIKKEDQNMREMLTKLIADETWSVDDEERTKVLSSSTDLIYYFKNSMKLCSSLTKNEAFYDLYGLFKKYLHEYCNVLSGKIPNPDARVSEREEKMICLIVNTAEYCSQTTTGMTDTIKKIINQRFADKIDLKAEQGEFDAVIAKGTKALVSALENKLELALTQMIKMPWGSWESVGDQSDYVNQISTYISQSVPMYNTCLANPAHFRFFCDSFVLSFIPTLIQHIYKCRRISTLGAQQLMLDFTSIKTILLELPNANKTSSTPVPSRYVKIVNQHMAKAESILKVILTPPATLVDAYKALIVDGNEADFQRIVELKGLTRSEQKALMDQYSQHTDKQGTASNKTIRSMLSDFESGLTGVFAKKDMLQKVLSGNDK